MTNFHQLSPSKSLGQIGHISLSDSKINLHKLISDNKPFITSGLMNDWPATQLWSLQYIKDKAGTTNVTVAKLNKNNTTDYKHFETMPFTNFAQKIEDQSLSSQEGGLYLIVGTIISRHAAKPLLPGLENDVRIPSLVPANKLWEVNLWIGAGGNTSVLHVDPNSNLLSMIHGYKKILLFPPSQSKLLYPYTIADSTSLDMLLQSQVDLHEIDFHQFPKIKDASYYEATIGPGESIHIPPGYWHYVVSEDLNIGVNIFWTPPFTTYFKVPIRYYFIKESLRLMRERLSNIIKKPAKNFTA